MKKRVVVLASGGGTNFQSIVDAMERGEIKINIVLVISNVEGAYVLERHGNHEVRVAIRHGDCSDGRPLQPCPVNERACGMAGRVFKDAPCAAIGERLRLRLSLHDVVVLPA